MLPHGLLVLNTDTATRGFLHDELLAGRLRQGWGYADHLDLRTIRERRQAGEMPTPDQEGAWKRCHYMLGDGPGDVREGDLVCVKAGPQGGQFTLARVTGGYAFDIPAETGDHGHVLPVEVLGVFHYDNEHVDVSLAAALRRARHPVRRTRKHHDAVMALAAKAAEGIAGDTTEPQGLPSKLAAVRNAAVVAAREFVGGLTPKEFEKVVGLLLEADGYDVEDRSGPGERGADLVATHRTPYGVDVQLVVQVKKHEGTTAGQRGVEQVEQALGAYGAAAGLLVTSADEVGENVAQRIAGQNVEALYGEPLLLRLIGLAVGAEGAEQREEG